jgi:hypothetical protein
MRLTLRLVWVPKQDPLHNERTLTRMVDRPYEQLPDEGGFVPIGDDGSWPKRVETVLAEGPDGVPELFLGSMYEINEGPDVCEQLLGLGFAAHNKQSAAR